MGGSGSSSTRHGMGPGGLLRYRGLPSSLEQLPSQLLYTQTSVHLWPPVLFQRPSSQPPPHQAQVWHVEGAVTAVTLCMA